MSLCAQLDTPTSKESKVRQCSTRGIKHIPMEDNRLELTSLLKSWSVFSSFELVLLQLSLPPPWLSRRTQVPAFRACLILQEIFSLQRNIPSVLFQSVCALLMRIQPSGYNMYLTKDYSWSNGAIFFRCPWEEIFMGKTGTRETFPGTPWDSWLCLCWAPW